MKLITNKLKNGLTNPRFTEYLTKPVPKSKIENIEADELRNTLESALEENGGLGLSANQIGIQKRACVIRTLDGIMFLLNPEIIYREPEGFAFYEGCLSIPKTIKSPVLTVRSTKIKVMTDNLGELEFGINTESDKDGVSAETLQTVIVQHEIDHLDGKTIYDRMYSTTVRKKEKYGRNDKILMKSPAGEFVEIKYKKANDYYLKGYEIV